MNENFAYENNTAKQASVSDTVKLKAMFLVNLIIVFVCFKRYPFHFSHEFCISITCVVISVLVITKVLVRMPKIQVKRNPSKT